MYKNFHEVCLYKVSKQQCFPYQYCSINSNPIQSQDPLRAASDLAPPDHYGSPARGHLPDRRAPSPGNVPQSDLSRRFGPPPTGELYSQHDPCYSDPHCSGYRDMSSDYSDGPYFPQEYGLQPRYIQSLARDIKRFDPGNKDCNLDDYLREVDHCLLDLPNLSTHEKLSLLWRTISRSVHVFMEQLPPGAGDCYPAHCMALREEYSRCTSPSSATIGALAIVHRRQEAPKEYYRLPESSILPRLQYTWVGGIWL